MYNYKCYSNVIAFKFNVGLVRFQIAVFLYEFVIFFCKKKHEAQLLYEFDIKKSLLS